MKLLLNIALGLLLATPLAAQAASNASGRWQGQAELPGLVLPMVVDLQQQGAQGWQGSVILPGRGVKGAVLEQIRVDERGVAFSLAAAFATAPSSTATVVELQWQADGQLAGHFSQGGHRAPLRLVRSGEAQVDLPPPSTPPAAELLGRWRGRYELGGYLREVTITLTAPSASGQQGEIVIVGKRRTVLPIDRVHQGRSFITLDSVQGGVRIEGRLHTDGKRIDGHFQQGPFEAALPLTRQEPGSP